MIIFCLSSAILLSKMFRSFYILHDFVCLSDTKFTQEQCKVTIIKVQFQIENQNIRVYIRINEKQGQYEYKGKNISYLRIYDIFKRFVKISTNAMNPFYRKFRDGLVF